MARLTINYVEENFKGNGESNEFFTLKNDRDTAVVRFLYEDPKGEDLDLYAVHEVEIAGKKRYVDCLQNASCELCKSGNIARPKLFLQLLDTRDGKVKTWERGKAFVKKIDGIINKYGSLVNREFEIERQGKAGDKKTEYAIYPLDKDGKHLEDFPEKQELLGTFILEKTPAEMIDLLNGVVAPTGTSQIEQQPMQRRRRTEEDVF